MQPGGLYPAPGPVPGDPDDPAARLAASARGWHSIQLAVLGFIGVCGVLRDGGAGPGWLQWLATMLSMGSLAIAGLAIYLVGRVAYPFYGRPAGAQGMSGPEIQQGGRKLRTGIRVTFLAVAAIATAGVSGWWPAPAAGGGAGETSAVRVRDVGGRWSCGQILDGPPGEVRLRTEAGVVSIALENVAVVSPVESC